MRFARLGPSGEEIPVVLDHQTWMDLRPVTADIDSDFWANGGPERVRQALQRDELSPLPGADQARVGAPLGRPSAVYCIGMNYAAHAAESGAEPPKNLVMFMKAPNTVIGPDDDVVIPRGSERTDWEVELGIVIGSRGSYLDSPEAAREIIGGYVLANDLSERSWQLDLSGGQWSKGKCAPGYLPTGPWIATPDEINADDVRLRSWVNSEPRQDSRTADLIFGIGQIISELSQYLTLEPGDLILTGTPEGVALSGRFPYLQPGDEVTLEIDGLGRQQQSYLAFEEATA